MGMQFGYKLKKIRMEKDMSQQDFAVLLGTSKQVISRYENNQRMPKITTVHDYAQKLNLPLNDLLEDTDTTPNDSTADKKKLPPLTAQDERRIAKDLENMLESLNGAAAYNDPEDEEDAALLKASLLTSMRLAKQIAKKKFTPKKYG